MQEAADPGLKRDRFRLLPTERPRQQTGIAPRRQTECSVIDLGPVCIDGGFKRVRAAIQMQKYCYLPKSSIYWPRFLIVMTHPG
jgi:hypothetical protein